MKYNFKGGIEDKSMLDYPMGEHTLESGADIYYHFTNDPSIRITINNGWFTPDQLDDLIMFLKSIKKRME